jgi:C4-dicarboxylate-specific signal transduction histidine kinase
MKVKLGQAVKMFFGNSSLEMVYFEAIANSLDAQATEIKIDIQAKAYNLPETISIKIEDNGIGITDDRYKKFSNLFDVEETLFMLSVFDSRVEKCMRPYMKN